MSFVIHLGDALTVLRTMPEDSVQCCVTSPPYWGLRDYGTGRWEGGAADCDHAPTRGIQGSTGQRADRTFTAEQQFKSTCRKCGALRVDQQIGLEETPEEFVATLIAVFQEIRRVLKPNGIAWINLGDSYAGGGCGSRDPINWPKQSRNDHMVKRGKARSALAAKQLIGIPWRVAFALQDAGWWLRSDIIWCKGSPMPESVKDRPTRAHEYIFLMTKSQRYFYDFEAVKEKASGNAHSRGNGVNPKAKVPAGWDTSNGSHRELTGRYKVKQNESFSAAVKDIVEDRNLRSWWQINSEPTPEAHFATFPIRLAERCILAGSRPGDVVLDPFAGAGTTGMACLKHGRNFVGIELNAEYIAIAENRARKHYPLFYDTPVFEEAAETAVND